MPNHTPELLREAISREGLLSPSLSTAQRRDAILRIAQRYDCSENTVRRQLTKVQQGAPPRKKRSDAGVGRALAGAVVLSLYKMLSEAAYANCTVTQLTELLKTMHPSSEQSITYSAVRGEIKRYKDALPKAISTPRRIEIAGANSRWEIDLSIGDLFIADPRLNHGFPFRPVLTVCEDACTRCCMFAQYSRTGRAVDVGSVLHAGILPKSDIWPQCGIPRELGADWGKVFVSEYHKSAMQGLGIEVNLGHPYYPQDKGKVERFIGTIHHCFENALVGWCTSNNRGDDSIDPRKFFRQVGAQWMDPRFDRPLFTLPELNALLADWIAGTYHRRKHGTLGCSPNEQWLKEMRGVQIMVPERKYLAMQFLPWQIRKVRRGQVQLDDIAFQSPLLSSVEGCNVKVRYLPDDISKVYVYYDEIEVCVATPAPTFIVNASADGDVGAMDWTTWNETRRSNKEQAALRRQVLAEYRNADIQLVETQDVFHANVADADPLFVAPPEERRADPLTAGMTAEEIAALQNITVYGMPVLPDGVIQLPTPPPEDDFDEAEGFARKVALA